MHTGGPRLQNTYFLLPGAVEETEAEYSQPYLKCIELLDAFYAPKLNRQHEAYLLRLMEQGQEEKFDVFVQRIRAQVERCALSNETAELMTVLQILSGVKNNETRRKILEKERSVAEAINIGRNDELLRENLKSYSTERGETSRPMVQRVVRTDRNETANTGECFNCGLKGHYAKAENCPAKGKKCNKCGHTGHFGKVCRGGKRSWEKRKEDGPYNRSQGFPNKRVRRIEQTEDDEDKKRNFVFYLGNRVKLSFVIGNCEIELRVDSGADITILSGRTWNKLKGKMTFWDHKRFDDHSCFGYEKGLPAITILGTIMTKIQFKDRSIDEKIYIAPNGNDDLIGFKAATALKALFVGDVKQLTDQLTINMINEEKFPKIAGYSVELEIDNSIKPVQQPFRKIPIALEDKVEEKVCELLKMDIIEPLEHPPTWLSPVVPVLKENGQVRLCVDMRRANVAIKKGFYAFESIDDLIFTIKKPFKLSKIDMSNAYYLFELHHDSRDITAFAVKSGNYRFKRLMFGIKSAPEEFSKGMDMIFQGLTGVARYMDDLLIYGESQEEHDRNLSKVMEVVEANEIPLNKEKCLFNMKELEFLGYMVSDKGIRQTDERVGAIKSLSAPKSKEELQSLLGLINYVTRFIPHLATQTEPLRRLLIKDVRFHWGSEHDEILKRIKDWMARTDYLGYFDLNDRTQVSNSD